MSMNDELLATRRQEWSRFMKGTTVLVAAVAVVLLLMLLFLV
ncbi:MAG: hypothetical protein ACREEE_05130 [Dongiaceae bacterium]